MEMERRNVKSRELAQMSSARNKVHVKNSKQPLMRDIYYYLMINSWSRVFCIILFAFISINALFATLYFYLDNALSAPYFNWWDCFFFSVQTFSTIGYGAISPVSFQANLLVSLEAAVGLLFSALVTGIVFSKFSRPSAKIVFSRPILINNHHSKRVLSFRVGNTRGNDIVDASLSVSALIEEISPEGSSLRRIKELKLERSRTPFFSLSWVVFHVLDESSPLFDCFNSNSIDSKLISIACLLTGHDGNYSQTVYSRYSYYPEDFVFDKYFTDVLKNLPDKSIEIDFQYFHSLY